MVYPVLLSLLKKHFYVIHQERLVNAKQDQVLERMVAKHIRLKPELIVINDQPHGFKGVEQGDETLEEFPVYIEVELSVDTNGDELVESVDVYSESAFSCKHHLSEVIYLANQHSQTVFLDRVRRVNEPSQEKMLIYSMVHQVFDEGYVEDDIEGGDTSLEEITLLIDQFLKSFSEFVAHVHDVVANGATIGIPKPSVEPRQR